MCSEFCWYSTRRGTLPRKSGVSSAKVGRIQPPPPKNERHRTFCQQNHLILPPSFRDNKNQQFLWLVVSTHLKNISQIGNPPQVGVKIKNTWNHHLENQLLSFLASHNQHFTPWKKKLFRWNLKNGDPFKQKNVHFQVLDLEHFLWRRHFCEYLHSSPRLKGPRRKAKVEMMALWAITSSRVERNLAINAPNKLKKPQLYMGMFLQIFQDSCAVFCDPYIYNGSNFLPCSSI